MAKNGKNIEFIDARLLEKVSINGNNGDEELSKIIVRGAREHNLKKIDVDIHYNNTSSPRSTQYGRRTLLVQFNRIS